MHEFGPRLLQCRGPQGWSEVKRKLTARGPSKTRTKGFIGGRATVSCAFWASSLRKKIRPGRSNLEGGSVDPTPEEDVASFIGHQRALQILHLEKARRANGWVSLGTVFWLVLRGNQRAPLTHMQMQTLKATGKSSTVFHVRLRELRFSGDFLEKGFSSVRTCLSCSIHAFVNVNSET